MNKKYYDLQNKRLVFVGGNADAQFWDKQWERDDLREVVERNGRRDKFVARVTKKFLEPKKTVKILEGGCGMGHFVYSLSMRGYSSTASAGLGNIVRRAAPADISRLVNLDMSPPFRIEYTISRIEKIDKCPEISHSGTSRSSQYK